MDLLEISKGDIIIPNKFIHDELNPRIWIKEGNKYILRQEVKDQLLEIANLFYEYLEIETPYEDIYFLGSMTSYNWTKKSDLDIHILFDFKKINKNVDLVKKYLDSKKTYWNDEHDIKIYNHEVELYSQSIKELNSATSIYSLIQDKWILKPSKVNFKLDTNLLRNKIYKVVSEIESCEDIKDIDLLIDRVTKVKEKIKQMRKAGLEVHGEFSIGNLTFKYLRNNGYLERLNTIKRAAVDQKLSLEL